MAELTVPQQLRARVRKYFLVVFGLIGGAVVLLMALGMVVKLSGLDAKASGLVLGISAPLLMLGVVAGSWVAVYKLWRCPKCDASIYWTVSWNMSVFAGTASPNCPGCGVELFTQEGRKRGLRILLILIAIAVGAGFAGAMFTASRSKRTPPPAPVVDTRPPG